MAIREIEYQGEAYYFVADALGMPVSFGYRTRAEAEATEELIDVSGGLASIPEGLDVERAVKAGATDTMVRVKWLAFASHVGQKDYTWGLGRSGDRYVLAWGCYAGQPAVPTEDVPVCVDGLSWHPGLMAAVAAIDGAADCYEGEDRDRLMALLCRYVLREAVFGA